MIFFELLIKCEERFFGKGLSNIVDLWLTAVQRKYKAVCHREVLSDNWRIHIRFPIIVYFLVFRFYFFFLLLLFLRVLFLFVRVLFLHLNLNQLIIKLNAK